MAKLSDLQLASLLEEIASAMRAGSPVTESMQRLQDRRLGRVAIAAQTMTNELERGRGVEEAILAISSPLADQASAAITACQRSGRSDLLNRMAAQLRRRSEFGRSYCLAWFYPLLLLIVGYAITVGVMCPLVQQFDGRGVSWPTWVLESTLWLQTNWHLPPIVILVVLILTIIWYQSRERFPKSVRLYLFCQSLADQIAHDMPEDEAIRCAARMSGDTELSSIKNPTLSSPIIVNVLSESDADDLNIAGTSDKQVLIGRLRYLSSIHAERARQRAVLVARIIPRIAMTVIGGGITISIALWVIAPVYRQVAQW